VNLLSPLPDAEAAERVDTLLTRPGLRIERIVSRGQASPPGFWYDQTEAEWVVVLAGTARLRFADETEVRVLGPGDWVDIAPHRRHRVDWTDPAVPTVWLAVFSRAIRPPVNRGEQGEKLIPARKTVSATAKNLSQSATCERPSARSSREAFCRLQGGKTGEQGGNRGGTTRLSRSYSGVKDTL
jgi:cupin 2 domain-containing protein